MSELSKPVIYIPVLLLLIPLLIPVQSQWKTTNMSFLFLVPPEAITMMTTSPYCNVFQSQKQGSIYSASVHEILHLIWQHHNNFCYLLKHHVRSYIVATNDDGCNTYLSSRSARPKNLHQYYNYRRCLINRYCVCTYESAPRPGAQSLPHCVKLRHAASVSIYSC